MKKKTLRDEIDLLYRYRKWLDILMFVCIAGALLISAILWLKMILAK